MEIDTWIGSCKVRILPWIDNKRIYVNVQYFRSGQSISQPPIWDKTVYITDNEAGKRLAYEFTDTLVNGIIGMRINKNTEITLTA